MRSELTGLTAHIEVQADTYENEGQYNGLSFIEYVASNHQDAIDYNDHFDYVNFEINDVRDVPIIQKSLKKLHAEWAKALVDFYKEKLTEQEEELAQIREDEANGKPWYKGSEEGAVEEVALLKKRIHYYRMQSLKG